MRNQKKMPRKRETMPWEDADSTGTVKTILSHTEGKGNGFEKKNNHKTLKVFLTLIVVAVTAVMLFQFYDVPNVKAEENEIDSQKISDKLVRELNREREVLQLERKQLDELRSSLKAYEIQLDGKMNDYLQKIKALKDKEEEFKKKVEAKTVDKQTVETYESIDPEQAAVLMKNLYEKDRELATMVMRKIAGKKAGKILEEMVAKNPEVSTKLAKDTLEFYKPEDEKKDK